MATSSPNAVEFLLELQQRYGFEQEEIRRAIERKTGNQVTKSTINYYFTLGARGFKGDHIPLNTTLRTALRGALMEHGVTAAEAGRLFGVHMDNMNEGINDLRDRVGRMEEDLEEIKGMMRALARSERAPHS